MTDDYEQFVQLTKRSFSVDLSKYKEMQMKRRLAALCEQHGFSNFVSFHEAMMRRPELKQIFLDKMTINVSSFFRNLKRWTVLETEVLPRLMKERRRLKIWSAACSTGEEPYTLSILLSQTMRQPQFEIIATDIDEQALAKAKVGTYSERSMAEMPESWKQEFFVQDGAGWRISDSAKANVRFIKHDLFSEPIARDFDLIVCRNVLIYFTNEAKAFLYDRFQDSLTSGGILFVGSTEQIFDPERYGFSAEQTFFYRKR
ncbi:MAG TPA: protein-glutamate O-methyltransferase CheR [Bacillales bacterium]|nr:protein-glutamate O-methyltransferase CheR [Bacillales bacterium]